MNIKRNIIVVGKHKRPIPIDIYIPEITGPKPVVLFVHGFKGFKDWGIWDAVARRFAESGFVFLKFNFSHNGTSPDHLFDFVDLEAFGKNNYTKELADLDVVLEALGNASLIPSAELNLQQITVIGHSRGGGISAIKAANDPRINAWIGWASVNDLAYAWRGKETLIADWKESGVYEILNGRTKQMMPLYYQLYEDFMANEEAYSVEKAIKKMDKPQLVIHGTADPAVDVSVTTSFKKWKDSIEVYLVPGADHVFGGRHPYKGADLPEHAQLVLEKTIAFLKEV